MTTHSLLESLDKLKTMMVAVSTGGPRIDDVNAEFSNLFDHVDEELRNRNVPNTLPYRDLWEWYGRWSSDLPTWASRRQFVSELFGPLVKQVKSGAPEPDEPTGWARVDRAVGRARESLARAQGEEDFQTVGLLCREILISLAQQVYDPARHPPLEDLSISPSDFKRMIDAYVTAELSGGPFEQVRKHARTSLDLALRLQHQRTANFRDAAICLQATTSMVHIIAIIEGRLG